MGAGHRPTHSALSFHSCDQPRDEQLDLNGANYYDDDDNPNGGPPQDCQWCDRCCACLSGTCEGRMMATLCGPRVGIWAVTSLVFWGILWSFAVSFPTEQEFTLRVGETWQVSIPPLWSRSTFGIFSTTEDPGVEVYAFSPVMEGKNAKCPLPSPETTKTLEDSATMTLQGGEHQYTYYQLNQGSKLSLDILQRKGSTNIYLLQGFRALKSLQDAERKNDAPSSFPDFRGKSIVKRFSGQGGETTFTYEAPKPDFYIVVYDNAGSFAASKLVANIHIDMTTHPVASARRVCSAKGTFQGGCIWKLTSDMDRRRVESSCIIARAISSESSENVDANKQIDATQVVGVRLQATVGSVFLIVLASIPVLIGIVLLFQDRGSDIIRRPRRRRQDGNGDGYGFKAHYQSVPTTIIKEDPERPLALNSNYMPDISERTYNTESSPGATAKQTSSGSSYQNSTY